MIWDILIGVGIGVALAFVVGVVWLCWLLKDIWSP